MTRVMAAHIQDIPAWLNLATQVEHLFGPLVQDPNFRHALRKNIKRGTAFCVRENDGPPGTPLMGGLLFSPHPPKYIIGWLAVDNQHRRQGIGHTLVNHVFQLVQPPAEIIVTTFGPKDPTGKPARQFYKKMGFRPAEMSGDGTCTPIRQIYCRLFHRDITQGDLCDQTH